MAVTSVSWCSSKLGGVSLYTAETELIALSEGAKESEWLWYILSEMGFPQNIPVQVWCDSNAAISIVKNPGNHKANKHIEILTKALPTKHFLHLREKLGVRDLNIFPNT
ncbi:Retroelement pol Polyprotein [Phytophthora megakarya]|uniref:Retroelement pol Polyprotein n=1 Tax=Phytophthora megakarya TaxID=4795 RepID=A0A225WX29_9STRA|nr:Retroelement pol Polyprotein [Phytophthora megakarya]